MPVLIKLCWISTYRITTDYLQISIYREKYSKCSLEVNVLPQSVTICKGLPKVTFCIFSFALNSAEVDDLVRKIQTSLVKSIDNCQHMFIIFVSIFEGPELVDMIRV